MTGYKGGVLYRSGPANEVLGKARQVLHEIQKVDSEMERLHRRLVVLQTRRGELLLRMGIGLEGEQ